MKRILLFVSILLYLFSPKAMAQTNQVVAAGASTAAANFTGPGCVFNWANDKPGIGLAASGTGDIPSFVAVNAGPSPVKATISVTPAPLTFAYIANLGSNNVSVINTASNTVVATIAVGTNPNGVAVSPDGTRVYVTNTKSNNVSVINAAANTVVNTITVGLSPLGVAVSPDGSTVYVANSLNDNVSVISAATATVTATISVGLFPQGVVFSPDGSKVFVANYKSNNVSVINTATNLVAANVTVGTSPFGMAISPDGKKVYVTNTNSKSVSVINTATNSIAATIPVGTGPAGISVSPDGTRIYAASEITNMLSVIDAATNTVTATIPQDNLPFGVSVSPDGLLVYVTNYLTGDVTITSTATNTIVNRVGVNANPASLGNFVQSALCTSTPFTFTITVTPQPPVITAGAASGSIVACAGTASVSPAVQQFTVSGSNLTGDITATAPAGFEVSLSSGGVFGNAVALTQSGGNVSNSVIYVRSSASAAAGSIFGKVTLNSPGATAQTVTVNGTVNALPAVNAVPGQTVVSGNATAAVSFKGTANTFNWVNDTPAIGLPASGTGDISSFTAANAGSSPVKATITVTPLSAGFAYIANQGANTISVINTATNAVVTTIPSGNAPFAVAVSPDGSRVYISNIVDNTVSVINSQTNAIIATVAVGAQPYGLAMSPDGTKLYVANLNDNTISEIKTATNTVIATFSAGASGPYGLAVSPDGSRLFVSCYNSGRLAVINTTTNTVIALAIADTAPEAVVVSQDGSVVYVVNNGSNDVTVINAATFNITATIGVGSFPSCASLSPDGSTLYVSNGVSGTVSVINTSTNTVTATIATGANPIGVSVSADGSLLYVVNGDSKTVSVINTANNTLVANVAVGTGACSLGHFVTSGTGCTGTPIKFTITVDPSPPTIVTTPASGVLIACTGSAATSPQIQQFTASGHNLTGDINVTAPANFELSLNANNGFGNSLTLTSSEGTVNNTVVYVRSTAAAPVGSIAGDVTLVSAGATTQQIAVLGTVNAFPTANAVADQTVMNGNPTTAINFGGTGNTFNWVNDTPGIGLAASGTGDISSFTAINTGSSPVTATITVTPKIAGYSYVSGGGGNSVSVIDIGTNKVIATIPAGTFPEGVSASRDGTRVFVANAISNNVSVINTQSNSVIATIPAGTSPFAVVSSPDGSRIYVTDKGPETLSVINVTTASVIATIPVGSNPQYVAISPDGSRVYVTVTGIFAIAAVNTVTNTLAKTIPLTFAPYAIVAGGDGSTIYVTDMDNNNVAVINTTTGAVVASIPVGTSPYGIGISPDYGRVYAANTVGGTVSVINAATNTVVATISVGASPWGVSVSSDGNFVYVANKDSQNVSVINAATNTVIATVPVGLAPYSFGNFTTPANTCPGIPVKFNIIVKPTPVPVPDITATTSTGNITACAGTASATPNVQEFAISGAFLTNNMVLTAPNNFEISLSSGSGYAGSLTIIPKGGIVNSVPIYIRSSASSVSGNISGNVTVTSQGAKTVEVPVSGSVNALPTVSPISNQSVNNGGPTTAINFNGTTNIFNWVNDTPGIGLAASGSGDIASFTAKNAGSNPITATIMATPVSPDYAYIPNLATGTVSVVNTGTNSVISTITVGTQPLGIALNADGSLAYVINNGSNSVSVINTSNNTVLTTIPVGSFPVGVAVGPGGKFIYVANESSNTVSVIDAGSNAVAATIPVGASPYGVAVTPDGSTVYVTNYAANSVSVISTVTNTMTGTIPVGLFPVGVVVSPDGSTLYVSNQNSNTVSVISTASNTVTGNIGTGTSPTGLSVSPDGSFLYVSNSGSNSVSVINTANNTAAATITVGSLPYGISVNADGSRVYVVNQGAGTVSVINTSTNSVTGNVSVGASPYAFGNFVIEKISCSGDPAIFTITVNPTVVSGINAGNVTGNITTCAGTASVNPNVEQFIVSGNNLSAGITLSAPNNFEISLSPGSGFGGTLSMPAPGGTVSNTRIYVRSAVLAPSGNISGNVSISSTGSQTIKVPVTGYVNALPTVNTVPNQTVKNGGPAAAISFTGTGNTFTWVNDTPGIGLPASGTGDIASFIAKNAGSSPVTATITATAKSVGYAYIANSGGNTVSVVNTVTGNIVTTVPVGTQPFGVSVGPDGRQVYVTNENSGTVSVISTSTNTVTATITVGSFPITALVSPDGSTVYVPNNVSNTISVISAGSNSVIATITTAANPSGIALSPDGSILYVACAGAKSVSVINTATSALIATIPVGKSPWGLSISPDGSRVYVSNINDYTVSVINTNTNAVVATVPVGTLPHAVAVSPDGSTVYVANYGSSSVSAISTSTNAVVATIPVGADPLTLSVSLDGSLLYALNSMDNTVSVIDPPTNKVTSTINVGSGPGSFGNFITSGSGCGGTSTQFTIEVDPVPPPVITAGSVTGGISACAGIASISPNIGQFTTSAVNLTADVVATAPAGFEVSLSVGAGFGSSVILAQTKGTVNSTIVYVRSSASAPPGALSGNVTLTSAGATTQTVAVTGFVNASPTVTAPGNLIVNNGQLTPPFNFTGTGNVFTWVNNTPSIGLAASGNGDIAPFVAINTGSNPVTATVTVASQSLAYAYIANSISNDVSVINLADNSLVTTIPVDNYPTSVSVSRDGRRVYVTNQRSNSVSVISTATNKVVSKISIAEFSPTAVTVSPDGKRLYVVNLNSNNVSVINTADNSLIATIAVGGYPVGVVVTPDGSKVYVSNSSNTVSVIDGVKNVTKTTIAEGLSPNGIAVSPDGSKVYVAISGANEISVISTVTDAVVGTIPVGTSPVGVAISPDGSRVYVSNQFSNDVSVINTAAATVTNTISVGSNPDGVSVNSDGSTLYVVNQKSNNVSVINTSTNLVTATFNAGSFPISMGNFLTNGNGCGGAPVSFTITVNQAGFDVISTTGTLTPLTTIYGTPSPSVSFNVSGMDLSAGIMVTPPAGFEVSLDGLNFSSTVTVGAAGNIASTAVYIRLAATTPVGPYSGNITLNCPGAADVTVAMPESTVTPALLTIIADDKTKSVGMVNPVLTASYIGFVNLETPAQLTDQVVLTTAAVTISPVGLYPIIASGATSPNYTITFIPGILTITPVAPIVIPNTFTPNGDGINDTWNIKNINEYLNCTVDIFNRYGIKLYTSIGYGTPWDGRYHGSALPVGTYYYIIDLKNGSAVLSGYVAIIR